MAKKRKFVNILDTSKEGTATRPADFIPEKDNCWIHNMPDSDYFRLPKSYHSSSSIMNFYQDKGMKRVFEYVKRFTPALEIGSMVHAHLLAPEEFNTKEMQEKKQRLEKEFPTTYTEDGSIKKLGGMQVVTNCVNALMDNDDVMDILSGCDTELVGTIKGQYYGGNTRIKCDAIHHGQGVLYDIKTSTKSAPAFEKSVCKRNGGIPYYIQAAHYLQVANMISELSGSDIRYHKFVWLYVSKNDFSTAIVDCPDDMIEYGVERIREFYKRIMGGKFEEMR